MTNQIVASPDARVKALALQLLRIAAERSGEDNPEQVDEGGCLSDPFEMANLYTECVDAVTKAGDDAEEAVGIVGVMWLKNLGAGAIPYVLGKVVDELHELR